MVATLLRLRFLVLRNSLRRSTWQLIAVIIGGLYGLFVLFFVVAGLVALRFASIELASTIVVLAGSAVVLGWIIVPLIFSGVEQTLEPARLVQYPIPLQKLLLGLALAGLFGVPGAVTLVASLGTVVTWSRSPLAAIAALFCAVLAAVTCVVVSRMVAALSVSLASQRRFREVSGVLVFIPLILLGPIILGVTQGVRNSADALPGLARALSFTPFGAAWSVPADVAAGDAGAAVVKLLIALATLALVTVVWRRALVTALVSPPASGSKRVARGRIGLFGLMPATPAGAIAARSLTYWFRDPRYQRQLIMVPILAVLFYFYSTLTHVPGLVYAIGPLAAFLLALTTYADISYDGTAFATHVADGVRGRDDRLGRIVALAVFAVPLIVILTVASAAISGSWHLLPALLGIALGMLLSGFGLTSVSSARIVIPVPAAGDNPFRASPGAGFTTALSGFAVWGILVVLALPELVLGVLAIVLGLPLLGWSALVVGLVLGAVFAVVGIRVGGAALDRSAPDVLTRLKALRGA